MSYSIKNTEVMQYYFGVKYPCIFAFQQMPFSVFSFCTHFFSFSQPLPNQNQQINLSNQLTYLTHSKPSFVHTLNYKEMPTHGHDALI